MLKPTRDVNESNDQRVSKTTLQALFDTEESRLLRYAFALTGRRAVAEEIVQECFLKLHAQWDDIDSPSAWLVRSIRNRAFNYIRDNQREVLEIDDRDALGETSNETPEDLMMHIEKVASVRQMLGSLSELDRTLVELKYFHNLKYRDISKQTGMSISNVGYRLHHILKELGEKLRPLGIDAEQ